MSPRSPPGNPAFTSLPNVVSPVSPKPLHYPLPNKIPVLVKQTDLGFNQTEAHTIPSSLILGNMSAFPAAPSSSTQQHIESLSQPVPAVASNGAQHHSSAVNIDAPTASTMNMSDANVHGVNPDAADMNAPASTTSAIDVDTAVPTTSAANAFNPFVSDETETPRIESDIATANINTHAPTQTATPTSVNYQALLDSLSMPSVMPQTASHHAGDHATDSSAVQRRVSDGPHATHESSPAVHVTNATNATQSTQTDSNMITGPDLYTSSAAHTIPLLPSGPSRDVENGKHQATGDYNRGASTKDDEAAFDQFLKDERAYVTEGNWEQFPHGSRLFIGDLHSERVNKCDVFRIFTKYGKLAQISLKQAYGFAQFVTVEACHAAIAVEQGRQLHGRKINLEISKPQKNRADTHRKRSRSPDRNRAAGGVDRYVSKPGGRGDRTQRDRRERDEYRFNRDSPPRDRFHGRDDRHGRRRSRSPPHDDGGRYDRYREPLPKRDEANEDDELPLPRRLPRDVPDIQVIVVGELDRNFIAWVERSFIEKGVRVDVMLLSPRLPEAAVIRRQILEGVLAVSRVDRMSQQIAKIPLQVFDRRGGADVRFDQYADLEPQVAAEVVLRAKASSAPSTASSSYGYGYGYGYGAGAGSGPGAGSVAGPTAVGPPVVRASAGPAAPAVATAGPDLSKLIGSMDANSLQQLLGAMQQPPSGMSGIQGAPNGLSQPMQSQHGHAQARSQPQQGRPPYGQSSQYGQQGAGQPDMANILARLGQYRQ